MKTFGAILVVLTWLAAVIASGYGYIHNIYLLVTHVGAWGVMEAVRAVGIIAAPLGVVMGYI